MTKFLLLIFSTYGYLIYLLHKKPPPRKRGYGVHTSLYKTKIVVDPPKSPLKRGTLRGFCPPFEGGLGDQKPVGQL